MGLAFIHTAIDALNAFLAVTGSIYYSLPRTISSVLFIKFGFARFVTLFTNAPLHAFDADVIKFVFHVIYLFFDFWLLERRERYAT